MVVSCLAALVFLVILFSHLVLVKSYALARVHKAGISQQLANIFATSLVPGFVRHLDNNNNSTTSPKRLVFDKVEESQVTVAIDQHRVNPLTQIEVKLSVQNLTGVIESPSHATKNETSPLPCNNDRISVDQLSMRFSFGLESDNATIRFIPDTDNFDVLGVHLHSSTPDDNCRDNELESSLRSLLQERLLDFIKGHLKPRTFSVSKLAPIKSPGGKLQIHLDIQAFTVRGDYLVLEGGATFTAHINRTGWKQGKSYRPAERGATLPVTNHTDADKLVACSLGVVGINNFVESAWYLSWSEAPTTEEEATVSGLCIPSVDDPCPFPPFTQSTENNRAATLALSTFFLPSGIFKHFHIYMLAQPPKFQAKENPSSITGSSSAYVYIDGTTHWGRRKVRLANITIPVSVTVTIPSYNSETGHFHGLEITDVGMGIPVTVFPRQPYANKLASLPFRFTEGPLNAKLQEQLPDANRNIAQALARMPLYINPLKNIPHQGLSLNFDLVSVSASTVEQDLGHGYLTLDADLVISAKEEADNCTTIESSKSSAFRRRKRPALVATQR